MPKQSSESPAPFKASESVYSVRTNLSPDKLKSMGIRAADNEKEDKLREARIENNNLRKMYELKVQEKERVHFKY